MEYQLINVEGMMEFNIIICHHCRNNQFSQETSVDSKNSREKWNKDWVFYIISK